MNAQEVISCAQALDLMPASSDAATKQEYVVVGYVTRIERNPSPSRVNCKIMQQWFFIDDTPDGAQGVNCYWCDLPDEYRDGLNIGDKVAVKGYIVNYNSQPEIKNGVVAMIERAQVTVNTYDLSVCEAVEFGSTLEHGEVTTDIYRVAGRIRGIDQLSNFGQHTFDIACTDTTLFKAYLCASERGVRLGKGDSVVVIGKLTNYYGTAEISNGRVELIEKSMEGELTYIVTVAEAVEVAMALPKGGTSEDRYAIHGFVDSIVIAYDSIHGNMSFFMTDNLDAPTYDFEAYRVRVAEDQRPLMRVGAEVIVTAALKRYYLPATEDKPEKDLAETVEGGTLIVIPPEGIESVNGKPSSVTRKILENGQVIIIRNGVRYNTMGVLIQ